MVQLENWSLDELAKRPFPRFDVTLFKSAFHLMPDPIRGLSVAAHLTREVLILNTPVANVVEREPLEGSLFLVAETSPPATESTPQISWLPSGPKVLLTLLQSFGFPHVQLHFYVKPPPIGLDATSLRGQKWGSVEMIAARDPKRLSRLKTVERSEPAPG
jgi:hypothetical protein